MKKLLLILSAVLVSVSIRSALLDPNTGWDYLNPYAYDLKSEVINNGQTLRLTYKFNAPGFGNSDDYNNLNPKSGGTGRGIQIYLLYKDNEGNFQRVKKDDGTEYKITSGGYNEAKTWSVDVNIIDIPDNCKGKELTWEAVVHGNIGRTKPKLVKATTTKPTNAYGIAVNNDPTHVRFAQMFVSEAFPSKREEWDYWKDRWGSKQSEYEYANSMLEYTPLLGFQCAHFKHYHNDNEKSHFASLWDWTNKYGDLTITSTYSYNYEPNRIKVSEDGRTFVSSFHPKASCAVLEYGKNRDKYNGHHFYNTIDNNWENNKDLDNISDKVEGNNNPFLYRRCVGMDVKGKGDNLKIILLWIDANAAKYTISGKTVPAAKFIIYEYELGLAEAEGYIATNKYLPPFDNTGCKYVHKIGEYSWDYQGWSSGGAFYQGARYGILNGDKQYLYNNMLRGFADLAYGTNDDVWVKIDYCAETAAKPKIIRVKLNNGTTTEYTINNGSTANYGGSGILIKDGMLITSPTNSTICLYEINANGELNATDKQPNAKHTIIDNQIGSWVTGFATDYAGNLFALTQASLNGENYTANILGIAMPYKKAITTRARGTFVVNDPIPNILATDLRYAPAKSGGKYVFSFFTNTKPEYAEIRFYYSYESMKQSLADVNADNFSGDSISSRDTENLACIYSIPKDKLKQGKIEVELGMVGGELNAQKFITNDSLPRGELYWSVYVQTRKSSVFAPIYQYGGITDNDNGHHRKTIIVNNYPETDMFGSLIVAHNPSTTDDATRANRGLHIYGINPDGNSNDEQATINNAKRYNKRTEYLNQNATEGRLNYPRRMAVAPDGKVYIADEGSATNYSSDTQDPLYNYWRELTTKKPYVLHEHGGVKIWDPDNPQKFTLFTDNRLGTSTGVAIWNGKLYATNTYDEYVKHINSSSNYTKEQQAGRDIGSGYGWNGFAEYILNKYTAPGDWSSWNNNVKEYALNRGDASGNCAIVAMDQGIWMCQHREHTVEIKEHLCEPMADNLEAYVLSFVPYNNYTSEAEYGPRTWRSCTTNGLSWSWPENQTKTWSNAVRTETTPYSDNSQKKESPLQSTPGAGLAYKKINDKEYLYVVNHDGNIVVFEIFNWESKGTSSAKPSVKHVYTYVTPESTKAEREASKTLNGSKRIKKWKTSFITSMCFDYAGNLVTTTGKGNHDAPHDILVYTMPYDRTNAREIQAPNSCRYIPPRVSHLEPRGEIELTIQPFINPAKSCYVDIFRPMPNTSFSTICLPFDLDMSKLTTEKYKGAEVLEFTGVSVNTIGGEKILELQFSNTNIIKANVPYIIKPEVRIPGIVQIQKPIQFVTMGEQSLTNTFDDNIDDDNGTPNNSITYTGVIPTSQIEVRDGHTLILVAENRLAWMLPDHGTTGEIYGFRGYFTLKNALPQGMQAIISKKDKTVTGLIDVNGQKVNIQKYLREGRVYIRMGDSLYTIDGQKVK